MNPTVLRTGALLERNAELRAVEEGLAAAASDRGGVLVVEGPAGIGKTRLVEAARSAAGERGFRVLVARASPLEREFGFGVVRDLLTPVVRDPAGRAALTQGAARLAAPALDLGETAAPIFATCHGIFWLVAELADRQPLLLAVDDAHWADAPSLRALHHLAHRIADLPVLLAVATRPPEPGGDAAELLEALAAEPGTTVLRPRPLSDAGTRLVLRTVFGDHVDDRFAAACHEVSEGNPLLLRSLASSLRAAGIAPGAAAVGAVHDRAPAIVSTFVLPLLRQLARPTVAVARALAVLGAGTELRFLSGVAGLDAVETARAVDRLVAAELVVREPRLDFAHPLVAQAVTDHMPAAELQVAHRAAARELAGDGLPREAVAAHLLQLPPLRDPWVVERLREAAREALAKGALQPAVTYLRRALAEPPAAEVRPELLFELGDAETRIDGPAGAGHLAEALAATTDPTARAHVALRLARGLLASRELPRALDVLAQAVAEADAADVAPGLRRLLEAEYIGVGISRPGTRADALARLDRLLPDARPDTLSGCMVLATASVELLQVPGRAAEAVDRATAALDGIVRLGVAFPTAVLYLAAPVLAATGEISRGKAAAEAAVADARARGAPPELSAALGTRAEAALRLGALLDAESDVRLAEDLAELAGAPYQRRLTLTTLLPVLIERADPDGAERELEGLQVDAGYAGLQIAVGELRLAQGRPDEALRHLLAGGARLEQQRTWTHPGLFPWRTHAALAHHRAGRPREARELADSALTLARVYEAPTATGIALRTLGQLTGDLDALAEAAGILAGTQTRLEHARALVELGAALRRANHRAEAREPLRDGLDLAIRLGAIALRRQAVDELAATGARPRSVRRTGVEALSPSERRVARLAAEGQTNRDIAQALFVTTKTVEVHLSACYRKLGITSRGDLAELLR
jgi:DNA-binding CsgD family transcriptional regulator/tetratricopeptide (TPR) repeat protein